MWYCMCCRHFRSSTSCFKPILLQLKCETISRILLLSHPHLVVIAITIIICVQNIIALVKSVWVCNEVLVYEIYHKVLEKILIGCAHVLCFMIVVYRLVSLKLNLRYQLPYIETGIE